jgi:hypothetical protein
MLPNSRKSFIVSPEFEAPSFRRCWGLSPGRRRPCGRRRPLAACRIWPPDSMSVGHRRNPPEMRPLFGNCLVPSAGSSGTRCTALVLRLKGHPTSGVLLSCTCLCSLVAPSSKPTLSKSGTRIGGRTPNPVKVSESRTLCVSDTHVVVAPVEIVVNLQKPLEAKSVSYFGQKRIVLRVQSTGESEWSWEMLTCHVI